MKNSKYWKNRFEALENSQHLISQKTVNDITPAFDKAQREIEKEIEIWYRRFADNNGITMSEAKKLLKADELKEFKWDVNEYIKYGRANAINQEWMKELENASARFHISRLEALKVRTRQSLEKAFNEEYTGTDDMLFELYEQGYYHTCFEIQRGINIGFQIGAVDNDQVKKIISKPWATDGKIFSQRIWESKTTVVNQLHQELTRMILQGKAPDEAIKNMQQFVSKKMKNSKYAAGRLVMTEAAFISSASQKDAFKELGVEKYQIVATLDFHTSEICQDLDGQVFEMKDYVVGDTAPPFHTFCRTTTVPYFNDDLSPGERIARGADGKTYYIPDNISYKEWKKKFVK